MLLMNLELQLSDYYEKTYWKCDYEDYYSPSNGSFHSMKFTIEPSSPNPN